MFDYDLFVVGGGSGGLSCAKAAGAIAQVQTDTPLKIALADFVKPSPQNSKWGLGGTCVNVGCIPKKLMHYVAKMGEIRKEQQYAGYQVDPSSQFDWQQMVMNVQMHIKTLNFGYRSTLVKKKVKYYNRLARVIDKNTIELRDNDGNIETVTSRFIVVAVGGRPNIPENIDKSLVITSDDLFSIPKAPGKTLVIGASYVALECAGFIQSIQGNCSVMVRSILLRGFDRAIADLIGKNMKEVHKMRFIEQSVPKSIQKTEDGKLNVVYQDSTGTEHQEIFDTVMFATGRYIDTNNIFSQQLQQLVKMDPSSGKIITDDRDCSSVDNIFAIGDCAQDRPELTPPAIQAGQLLAQRLFAGSQKLMDYQNVATTVFTPLEYGCVGYNEEQAITKYGENNIEIYHSYFKPLEQVFDPDAIDNSCYAKVIVINQSLQQSKADQQVIGVHYLGPNAGEVIQGFSLALKCGVRYQQFIDNVGIHPTCAEELVGLTITKRDNAEPLKEGC